MRTLRELRGLSTFEEIHQWSKSSGYKPTSERIFRQDGVVVKIVIIFKKHGKSEHEIVFKKRGVE